MLRLKCGEIKKASKIRAYKNNGENGWIEIAGLSGAAARTGKET